MEVELYLHVCIGVVNDSVEWEEQQNDCKFPGLAWGNLVLLCYVKSVIFIERHASK